MNLTRKLQAASTVALLTCSLATAAPASEVDPEIALSTTEVPVPGDANGDGTFDVLDLEVFLNNYDLSVESLTSGDYSGDGWVDLIDLDLLGSYFGLAPSEASRQVVSRLAFALTVPEPSALFLAGMLVVPALCGRRHKR